MSEEPNKPYAPRAHISARNVLPARIHAIRNDGATNRLELALQGGEILIATVARESVTQLDLTVGREIVAMIKAPWLDIVANRNAHGLSSENRLAGRIIDIRAGTVNAEVYLRTDGGNSLVAVLPQSSVAECGLTTGLAATAIINPSDVVIGVRN